MQEIVKKLKENTLEIDELNQLFDKHLDDHYIVNLISKNEGADNTLKDKCYGVLLTNTISADLNPRDFKLLNIHNEFSQPIDTEYDHMVEYSFENDATKEEIKALQEMGIDEKIRVKGKRVNFNNFLISLELEKVVVEDSPILEKKKGSYLFKKAVMISVLIGVVSGISEKSFAQDLPEEGQTYQYYMDDGDKVESQMKEISKNIKDLKSDIEFLGDHLDFEKKTQTLDNISSILKKKINSLDDIGSSASEISKLDAGEKMDMEYEVGKLKDIAAERLAMKSHVEEKINGLDDMVKKLEKKAMELSMDSDLEKLQSLKANKNLKNLKDLASTSTDELRKDVEKTDKIYSFVLENKKTEKQPSVKVNQKK